MKTYHLNFETNLPIPLDEAWDFFSSPLNLGKITPPEMKFRVTSNFTAETKIYPGMLITYKVSPVLNIPLNWISEITQVKTNVYFVDEQRSGPYALWHHEHHFSEIKGGVQLTDKLAYALPLGVFGQLANKLMVEKQIHQIFNYRQTEINKLFGVYRPK